MGSHGMIQRKNPELNVLCRVVYRLVGLNEDVSSVLRNKHSDHVSLFWLVIIHQQQIWGFCSEDVQLRNLVSVHLQLHSLYGPFNSWGNCDFVGYNQTGCFILQVE
uniref:Uncharacterized protein n=1 Tax=Anguilla anguilla TaxID=7936 RepID=A0A0E9XP74_ANGAN